MEKMNRISLPHACAASGKEYRIAFAMRAGKYRFECIEAPAPNLGMKGKLAALMRKAEPIKSERVDIDADLFDGNGRHCVCGQDGFVFCSHCGRHVCEARSREGWFVCAAETRAALKVGGRHE
jgi:hypothetical protein